MGAGGGRDVETNKVLGYALVQGRQFRYKIQKPVCELQIIMLIAHFPLKQMKHSNIVFLQYMGNIYKILFPEKRQKD